MTDNDERARPDTPPPARMSAPLAALGLFCTFAVPAYIDYWIVRIRWEYMAAFPEDSLRKPPTISRAMADVPLGADMGLALSVCAVLLAIGAGIISLLYIRTAAALPLPEPERRQLAWRGLGIFLIQLPVSIGMVMQSVYTLAIDNDLHMIGSYLLFFSAAIGQIISIFVCVEVLRQCEAVGTRRALGLIHPVATRMRTWFAVCALLLTVFYLGLFVAKDVWDSATLYAVYVSTEVVVIAALMAYLMLHAVEFVLILRAHGRSGAASRKPASPAEGR